MQIKYYFKDNEGNSKIVVDTNSRIDNIEENRQYIMKEYGAKNVFACITNEETQHETS